MPPWQQILDLFNDDERTIPDVFVGGLSPDELIDVYDWIMTQCTIMDSPTPIAWSIKAQADVPVASLPSPVRAFVEGEIEYFRHGLAGLAIDGVELPLLIISMEGGGCIAFDYQKGPDWTETTICAFLEMLARLRQRAPGARIWQVEEGDRMHTASPHFLVAFGEFEAGRTRSPVV